MNAEESGLGQLPTTEKHDPDCDAMLAHYDAVVFDLFGTLVDAPTESDLRSVSHDIAQVLDVSPASVERAITSTWRIRHDGTLPTSEAMAAHLAGLCTSNEAPSNAAIADVLRVHAERRLRIDEQVVGLLNRMSTSGVAIGILSDASPEIAEMWPACVISSLVKAAIFSCRAALLKPAAALFSGMSSALEVVPSQILYCGDGGGDELRGALRAGFSAVQVARRGGRSGLAFGYQPWPGPYIDTVELLPGFVATGSEGGLRRG
jgi:putative hydrolase of the HAD superfamily